MKGQKFISKIKNKSFAILDCNNFFVSCERVFNAKLHNRPVVVLSNNDGCVISRSQEAKQLGIPMGAPAFQYQALFERHDVAVYSSNFELYGDLSRRVMQVLENSVEELEVYSIDEAFFQLPFNDAQQNTNLAKEIVLQVKQQVGIPVSIGIGATKTLAKLANDLAKSSCHISGVYNLEEHEDYQAAIAAVEVEKVWGIGRRSASNLRFYGIFTVADLLAAPEKLIRKVLSVVGLRLVYELKGYNCLQYKLEEPVKKSMTSSRSFGQAVIELAGLEEAVAYHISKLAEKLRAQNSLTKGLNVFIRTNKYSHDGRYYANTKSIFLPEPSNETPILIRQGLEILKSLYRPGYVYTKAGATVFSLQSTANLQLNLFDHTTTNPRQEQLMNAVDQLNTQMTRRSVFYAVTGSKLTWLSKRAKKSAAFTSSWQELLRVKA